jgi:beta-lactamase class A
MNNGPWFGIQENELFSPASLVKVPLMITYLKKAEQDPSILDQEILNTTIYDPKTQNIQPEVVLNKDQKYTIRQLIEQMIIYSDDVSYNLLNQQIPSADIIKIYNELGVDVSKALTDPNGDIISVKDYASFFRILFNASYLNQEMSNYGLTILNKIKFKDGLIAGIPNNISVAHKFGERQYLDTGLKQLHDCGIVYLPGKPYLLCVMTRGNDFNTLKNTIKNISQLVFQEISSLNN